jgi:hypothetical protein
MGTVCLRRPQHIGIFSRMFREVLAMRKTVLDNQLDAEFVTKSPETPVCVLAAASTKT